MVDNFGKYSSALPTMHDLRRVVVLLSRDMKKLKCKTESSKVDGAAMKSLEKRIDEMDGKLNQLV